MAILHHISTMHAEDAVLLAPHWQKGKVAMQVAEEYYITCVTVDDRATLRAVLALMTLSARQGSYL